MDDDRIQQEPAFMINIAETQAKQKRINTLDYIKMG